MQDCRVQLRLDKLSFSAKLTSAAVTTTQNIASALSRVHPTLHHRLRLALVVELLPHPPLLLERVRELGARREHGSVEQPRLGVVDVAQPRAQPYIVDNPACPNCASETEPNGPP